MKRLTLFGAIPASESVARNQAGNAAPIQRLAKCCVAALALAAATLTAGQVQAQPSAAEGVTPPARADLALRGNVLATRNVADHSACQSECQRTSGCTGYSFDRAAKATCSLLGGALTDVALKGAVSCRMPCEPGPRITALPKHLPATALRNPVSATAPAPDKPVSLLPGAPVMMLRQLPAAPVAGTGTASTQSASFGTGPVPYTPPPPCVPGRVSQVGMCGSGAVAAAPVATSTTVTLLPVNDNTIASSGLNGTYENSVYPYGYWVANTPRIGMGCDQLFVALSGNQYVSCARGLIKFNLASLVGKTIQSATLTLTTSAVGVGTYKDPWYVAAGASPWSGSTVTWINYGGLTHTASISNQNAPTQAGQVFSLDQTATVRNWVSGAYANDGFAMGLTLEQLRRCGCVSLDHFEFHSNEDPNGRGPKLLVTYQ